MFFSDGIFGGIGCLRSFGGNTKNCRSLNPSASSESIILSTKDGCMKPDILNAVCFMDAV